MGGGGDDAGDGAGAGMALDLSPHSTCNTAWP